MRKVTDILFVNANASQEIYQELGNQWSAIEPPIWAGMLASHVRTVGFNPEILDCEALQMTDDVAIHHIKRMDPRLVAFVIYGQQPSASSQNMAGAVRLAKLVKEEGFKVLFVGGHVAALPKETLEKHPEIDFVCTGEGIYTISNLLFTNLKDNLNDVLGLGYRIEDEIFLNLPSPNVSQEDLSQHLPGMAWDLLPMKYYRTALWHSLTNNCERQPFASLYTSLNCPFSCLRGDTKVNTIYGDISIKELAEKYQTIPVYTYDINKKEVLIANAINIQKTGINKELVRVHFDDGTHIDCTPDHKFLLLKYGGPQKTEEIGIEAKDIKSKMRVRAFKKYTLGGYYNIQWGRGKSQFIHRLIIEYKIGRKIIKGESCHHIDKNKLNNHPDNLQFFEFFNEHMKFHKPVWSKESRLKLSNSTKGIIKRTTTQKEKYRLSKLGKKSPSYKHGKLCGVYIRKNGKRIYNQQMSKKLCEYRNYQKEINHKVVRVEFLQEKEDVYCMEVPNYGWFFANNVLVKNCSFCCINAPFGKPGFKYWEPEVMIKEFDKIAKMGITNVKIADEMFVMNPNHFLKLCSLIVERGYKFNIWCYARVDITKPEYLEPLKKAGVNWLALGIESSNKRVRKDVYKGRFENTDIQSVVKSIRDHGINVMGNFIFGLPEDDMESMQETLDLAINMNTEGANFYSAMCYAGSQLYKQAIENNWKLPETYSGFSQHSYYAQNLPSKYLTSEQILAFRDNAWMKYHTNPSYLDMLEKKFGIIAKEKTIESTKIKLRRQILGD